jgi:PKD repeat protein
MKRLVIMLGLVLSVVSFAAIGIPAAAQAATVPNDSFADATVISSLPFSTTEDTTGATSDPSDPDPGPAGCNTSGGSVWFSFTPSADMTLQADAGGDSLSVWTGTQGSLTMVTCSGPDNPGISFPTTSGTTYYIMAGTGGTLQFSLSQKLPPGNDNFANATPVGALPHSDWQDLSLATVEPGEPVPSCFTPTATEWYSFTPQTTQWITAHVGESGAGFAVYTGDSLANLAQAGCSPDPNQLLVFRVQAGTTYYFQVGAWCCEGLGSVSLDIDVAANPVAQFSYWPDEPSALDPTTFIDQSYDPSSIAGFSSRAWDFGDGATSTDEQPSHRYAADGDYTVHLTVTTPDGRSDTTSQVLQVRTHDVAITRLAVPDSAHAGQTITINAFIQNTHYPETVQVDLYKSDTSSPGGFSQTGSLTQRVPVKLAGQTTRFAFTYTITRGDKAGGKIAFRADATIVGHRDPTPGDNQLLSAPVKIR